MKKIIKIIIALIIICLIVGFGYYFCASRMDRETVTDGTLV